MKMRQISSLVALILPVVACSKPSPEEQKKAEEKLASALSAAMATAAPPAAGSGAARAGSEQALMGSCLDKPTGYCKEFLGILPMVAEEFCKKGDTSVLRKGATPCPREGYVGVCETKIAEGSERFYSYKSDSETFAQAVESAKMRCALLPDNVWTAAPAPAAAAATPATKKPAAAPSAKKK
jgi:hypothetical protein